MAIIVRGKTACPLCGKLICNSDDVVATPHFLHSGPLSRFSDAAMHRSCFAVWPDATAFRAAFNKMWPTLSLHPRQMLEDGSIVEGQADKITNETDKARLKIAVIGVGEDREQLLAGLQEIEMRRK